MEKCKEYSIAMIKPGRLQSEIYNIFLYMINKYGLEVVFEKKLLLNSSDIDAAFENAIPEYRTYLLSGSVLMIMIFGENPYEKLFTIKDKIRSKYNVWGKMENLLHTVDQGNEYHIFLRHFFSDLYEQSYCNSVDQNFYVTTNNICDLEDVKNCSLKYISLNFTNSRPDLDEKIHRMNIAQYFNLVTYAFDVYIYVRSRCVQVTIYCEKESDKNELMRIYKGRIIEIGDLQKIYVSYHVYFSVSELFLFFKEKQAYKNIIMQHDDDKTDYFVKQSTVYKIIEECKERKIESVFCFRPDYELIETEYYMDICRLLQIKESGGSCGSCRLGEFSVSSSCL